MCVIADRPLSPAQASVSAPVSSYSPLSKTSRDYIQLNNNNNFIIAIPSSTTMHHSNTSEYTLNTVHDTDPLLPQDDTSFYGSTQDSPRPSSTRLLLSAALRMAAIFLVATLLLGGTLFLALPTLSPCVPFDF